MPPINGPRPQQFPPGRPLPQAKAKLAPVVAAAVSTGLVALLAGFVLGAAGDGATTAAGDLSTPAPVKTVHDIVETPGPTVTVPGPEVTVTVTAQAPKPKPKPKPKPAATIPGDGTFIVGTDIKPGTYRSKPAPDEYLEMCIWQRLSGTSGEVDDFIAGDMSEGQVTVTIRSTDKAFETQGCETWVRIS